MHTFMKFGAIAAWLMLLALWEGCSHSEKPNDSVGAIITVRGIPKKPLFESRSSLPWVSDLARVASCTIQLPDVLNGLGSVDRFTHTDMTPDQVKASVINFKSAGIKTYRTKNPLSKAIATTFASDRDNLYLNTRRNPRPMPDMVNTACHELGHINGFGHGDNSPKGKEKSVPYYLGALCEKYAHKCIIRE